MRKFIAVATLVLGLAVALAATSAFAGGGGRLSLYLVNSGPASSFYPLTGDCFAQYNSPSSLSTTRATSLQTTSVGYDPEPAGPSIFSYTVPAGGGFTIPAGSNSVILKLWALSGDGSCPGQLGDQVIYWRFDCAGPTCNSAAFTAGYQPILIPAGTPPNTLFNVHAGPASAVTVGAGDTLTLKLWSASWAGIQWSGPNGAGVSSVNILQK
jgi:hypothetical protein